MAKAVEFGSGRFVGVFLKEVTDNRELVTTSEWVDQYSRLTIDWIKVYMPLDKVYVVGYK